MGLHSLVDAEWVVISWSNGCGESVRRFSGEAMMLDQGRSVRTNADPAAPQVPAVTEGDEGAGFSRSFGRRLPQQHHRAGRRATEEVPRRTGQSGTARHAAADRSAEE